MIIGEDIQNFKSAASQQVFCFVAEQITHLESVHDPLLLTVWVGQVIDQLNINDLLEVVPLIGFIKAAYFDAFRGGELRFRSRLLTQIVRRDASQGGVEDIEDKCATRFKVVLDVFQAFDLILNGDQVLEGTEWSCNQGEFLSQIKIPHVALHQFHLILNKLGFFNQGFPTHIQHMIR